MLTVISGNGRSGYSCALNKENDIFNNDISPFGLEGLTYLIKARQKEDLVLTGLLCLILSPINMTDSDKLTGYASMLNVCADNVLDKQDNFSVSPSADKEKGLNTHLSHFAGIDFCPVTSPKSHHNWHLQATGNLAYSRHQHLKKTGAGPASLNTRADRISRSKVRFFYVRFQRCAPIMAGRNGGASALAGFSCASLAAPIRLATLPASGLVRLQNLTREATTMAAAYTRPEFIDTYWIIPEYETTPYGKVSLTRKDRRTFIALFKDSRLIWAGRQPVKYLTENVICTQLQKVGVKRPTTITEIVTVQGVAHV